MEIKLPHQYEDFWNGKVVPNLKKNIRTVHELNSVLNDIQDGLNESEVKFSILEDFQTVEKKLDLTKEKFFDEVLPFMCEKALGITKFKDINYLTPVDVPRRYTNKTPAKPPVTTTPTPTKTPTKAPTQTNKTPSTPQTSTKQIHLPPHAKTNDTIRKEWEYEASLDEATRRKRYNVKPVTIDKVVSWDKYPKGFTANPKSKFKVNDEINKKVAIFSGSVVHMEVDGIVNAANEALRGGGGVDGATHAAAGGKLKQEGIVIGGCDPGDVKITRGYNLPAKYVLNAVAPRGIGKNRENEPLLESCYRKCLELAKEFEIRTLAFCCLGVGIFNYPLKDATKSALRITREFLEIGNNKDSFDKIIFVQFAQKEMDMYEKYMPSYFPKTQKISAGENDNLNPIIDMVLTERSVELSREHVLSLMANAFFGTFNISPSGSQAKKFFLAPLFEPGRGPHYLFILNYFIRMMEEPPTVGNIKIVRRTMEKTLEEWENSDAIVTYCEIRTDEIDYVDMNNFSGDQWAIVDFANADIGGGVLRKGSAQEEILFLTRPECIVSMLICPRMQNNEVIFIEGSEKLGESKGYSNTLAFESGYIVDTTEKDSSGSIKSVVIAMDAIDNRYSPTLQFTKSGFIRDLNKAANGFIGTSVQLREIYTGAWGTGVFKGNKDLKFLQQLLAASDVSEVRITFSFEGSRYQHFNEEFVKRSARVGQVVKAFFRAIKLHGPNELVEMGLLETVLKYM